MWSVAGNLISWIIAIGGVLAAAFAVMYYGTSRVLKETVDALERRAVVREQLLTDATAEAAKHKTEAEVLRNIVTGEAHLVVIEGKADQIARGLTEHHAESMDAVEKVVALLTQIAEQGES